MKLTYDQRETENRKVVDAMFRRFERTKAASAFSRTRIAKTGAIDPLRVVNYRLSDDIFRRNAITPKGKSHGVLVFLDWSGSMEDIVEDSVNQVMMLADFCQKARIPFEVYLFSDSYTPRSTDYNSHDPMFVRRDGGFTCDSRLHLVNVLSSRASRRQHTLLKKALFEAARANAAHEYNSLRLGGTPLDSAILASRDLIRKFQADNKVEIVNAVWITDGQGCREIQPPENKGLADRVEFVEGNIRVNSTTQGYWSSNDAALYRWCAATTGANILGIFLTGKVRSPNAAAQIIYRHTKDSDVTESSQEFFNNGFIELKNTDNGYDRFFMLNPTRPKGDTSATISDDAGKIAYRNAMIREGKTRKAQTAMMECVAESIARGRY